MARYILIDNYSGYIFGDTGDLDGAARDETPLDAARRMDHHIREYDRSYEDCAMHELASNESGYHVYRADINGSEVVPLVSDGQDRETIEAVEALCKYVGTVRTARLPEGGDIAA